MPAKGITEKRRAMNQLFAEWAKLSPELDWECTEREARLRFANEVLHPSRINARRPDITSWNEMSLGEIRRVTRAVQERSGSSAAYRAKLLAIAANELWGDRWNEFLRERIRERYQTSDTDLTHASPRQAHELLEELISRIARQKAGIGSSDPNDSPETVEAWKKTVRGQIQAAAKPVKNQKSEVRNQKEATS